MNVLFFYATTVLIWGSTWLAITFQLGTVSPDVSVAYRFALAALILLGWCAVRRKDMRYPRIDHVWIALQGFLLFSANYYVFYLATELMTSGLVAVAFSSIIVMNIIFGSLFFKTPIRGRVVVGATLGMSGLALVFWHDIVSFSIDSEGGHGLMLCLFATALASLGNMAASRNQRRGLPILQTNALGMAYGAAFMFIFAAVGGSNFVFDTSPAYIASLFYLAFFGSVIAFGSYLSLLKLIGADRAGYAAVLFPVIALSLSAVFENYVPDTFAAVGIALILAGNALILTHEKYLQMLWSKLSFRQA